MKKGNKYEQIPEHTVDLHGLTTGETQVVLDELLLRRDYRHIRIITGKGRNSEHGPILPNFVKNYLTAHGIRFSQSKIHDGGEGALEVFF
jgi:DNA-nicking Smr family endonuclease